MAELIDLRKKNFLARPIQRLPLFYPSLKSSQLAVLVFTGIFTLKSLKKRSGFKAGVVFEEVLNPQPILGKGIRMSGPVVNGLALAGYPALLTIAGR